MRQSTANNPPLIGSKLTFKEKVTDLTKWISLFSRLWLESWVLHTGLCGIPTAKQDTNKKTRAWLNKHLPEEALLDSVLRHKESLLEQGRKKQTFHTCCQEWQCWHPFCFCRRSLSSELFHNPDEHQEEETKPSNKTWLCMDTEQTRRQENQGLAALFPPQLLSSRVCLKRRLGRKKQNLIYQHWHRSEVFIPGWKLEPDIIFGNFLLTTICVPIHILKEFLGVTLQRNIKHKVLSPLPFGIRS